jgi:hypothetical protein
MSDAHSSRYAEDAVLTDYVLGHHSHLFDETEGEVLRAIGLERKAALIQKDNEALASEFRRKWVRVTSPQVALALEAGEETSRRGVRDRLLREHGREIVVNRCPRCHRIVRTPKARQCLWCGHDWH